MDSFFAFLFTILSFTFPQTIPAAVDPTEPDHASHNVAIVVSVIDGDTIVVDVGDARETVRYIGIDTPEPYRDKDPACYSLEASARNVELVAGRSVSLVSDQEDRDRYGRLLRYVYVDGVMVNEILVQEGYATTMTIEPNSRFADVFEVAQDAARTSSLGLWRDCV